MPIARSRFDLTSFSRKLKVYWEAWKQRRHVEHLGLKQVRVLTVTDNRERVETMLEAVNDVTEGKGSNFFLFGTFEALSVTSPLDVEWISGKSQRVRLAE
jgi:hypothetical protein